MLPDLKDFEGLPLKFWSQDGGKNGGERKCGMKKWEMEEGGGFKVLYPPRPHAWSGHMRNYRCGRPYMRICKSTKA